MRFIPLVEMTNLPNPTFYETINIGKVSKSARGKLIQLLE